MQCLRPERWSIEAIALCLERFALTVELSPERVVEVCFESADGLSRPKELTFEPPLGFPPALYTASPSPDPTLQTAEWLTREIGVTGVPGSSFFREPMDSLIRFHYAKKEETLRSAGERLLKLRAR